MKITSPAGDLIAIIVKKNFGNKYGVNFISDEEFPIQLGVSWYKKGGKIDAHHHIDRKRVVYTIQEFVYIQKGRVNVKLFDLNNIKFHSVELSDGDIIFFVNGGHGFDILEDTKLIEVKQGPYLGKDKDKKVIE